MEAGSKTDPRHRFLDISALFGRPFAGPLVRLFLASPVSPVHLTLAALAAGLAASWAIAGASRAGFVAGALLLQIKNVFDTADGHLARARGRPSYVGRYLDSLVDFLVNVSSHAALALALTRRGWPAGEALALAALASLSAFLQCSTYVYYTVSYLHRAGRSPTSRVDERASPPEGGEEGREPSLLVHWLHRVHVLLYGWQDAFARSTDRRLWLRVSAAGAGAPEAEHRLTALWYDDRGALTRLSGLGLGTQLAAMSLALAVNRPWLYFALVLGAGNLVMAGYPPFRAAGVRRSWRKLAVSDQASSILGEPPAA